jgi:hypothetical protein
MKPLFFVLIQHTIVISAFINYQAPHLGSTHALLFNALTNLTQTLVAFSQTLINQVKANDRWYWRLFFTVFFQDNGAARDERAALWQAALTWYFTLLHDALLDPAMVSQTPNLKKATQDALTAAKAQFDAACDIYHHKVPTESWCRDKDRAGYEALKQAFTVVGDCQDKIATLRWEQHLTQEKEAAMICSEKMRHEFRDLYQEALLAMLTTQWQAVTDSLPNTITPVVQDACWQTVIANCKQDPAYQTLYNRFKKYNTVSMVVTDNDWPAFKAAVLSAKRRSEKDEAVSSSSPRPTSSVARSGFFAAANTPTFSSTSSMSLSSTSTSTTGSPSSC